ncbi:unnamed protein product [Rhizoctonia solani]|uniref:RNase III domain-containing protein n=1 Tax=Rhizoctonia solani TaxID=456999 RepID=A0A8H3HFL1_9AGAM|nr:unnamed protein product [Rhizoctonia solani]CAE6526834.1 unnamed protein product [Rhizoctonia solani]
MESADFASQFPTMDIIFKDCPTLPWISDATLRERVFTHRSFVVRPTNTFEDNPNDPIYDNESLEHLGDSVVNLCTTRLIQSLYPYLHAGPASRMRALVVANSHLARFTQHYMLHFQLRGNTSQQLTIQASVPIHADLFEAYVGALFQEQGLDTVYDFLSKILTPSICLAYEVVRANYVEGEVASPQAILVFPSMTVSGVADLPAAPLIAHPLPFTADSGCTSLLNQHFAQQHKNLDWEFSPPAGTSSAPLWEVKAVERGGMVLATATAGTKKTAKNIAARRALIALGILQDSPVPHTGTEMA